VRAVRVACWAAGAALCALLATGAADGRLLSPSRAAVGYGVGFFGLTVAVVLWDRRPDSRTGLLLTLALLVLLLGDLGVVFPRSGAAVTTGFATIYLGAALVAHAVLSYPTGRLTSRLERGFVVAVYAFAVAYALPLLLLDDPQAPNESWMTECVSCARPYTHVAWANVHGTLHVLDVVLLVLILAFMAILVVKIVRAAPVAREVVLPLAFVTFLGAVRFAAQTALWLDGRWVGYWTSATMFWFETAVVGAIPLSLAAGMLWGRSSRGAVADLVVELERTPPVPVRDALARTLGDPSLELALWLPERAAYVDGAGRLRRLPADGSGRAVTVLGPAEAPVAALVHDPALLERPALLRSAGAAARLALENERLQAALRLQLAELRASRTRIVSAGDEERRRLERDLHDGAQQRLLGLGLALQLARSELGPDANGAAALLDEAEVELRSALDELRELAAGIHPAVLTEHGLAAALGTLAARASLPVELREAPEERLPAPVEAAAYFVVSEALANSAKHSGASAAVVRVRCRGDALVVEVEDDGAGGAAAVAGGGLAGLADRVHALDGELAVESPPGRGTRLRAEIPLAVAPVAG
jgi:signal transduction histidine kinase